MVEVCEEGFCVPSGRCLEDSDCDAEESCYEDWCEYSECNTDADCGPYGPCVDHFCDWGGGGTGGEGGGG